MAEQKNDEGDKSASATELKPPTVNDFKDFAECDEVGDFDDDDNFVVKSTCFMLIDKEKHAAWIGSVDLPQGQVKLEQAVNSLARVPDEAIYPPAAADMQAIAASGFTLDDDTWLKRPLIHGYDKSLPPGWIANQFLDEIKAHQLVEQNPHRNLVKFKGALEKDGLIVALLQKRYPVKLSDRVESFAQPPYDPVAFFKDIEAGIKHLHSLGLAHNDLNPENVMVDAEDKPVIIDLGACKPFGKQLFQGGTPGWDDGFRETSSVANDDVALRVMKNYLHINKKM